MTPPTPVLITERLALQPLVLDDAEAIQQLFPHWQIIRYLAAGMPWPYPVDGTQRLIRDVTLPAVAAGKEWAWSIRALSEPDRLIGAISLMDKPDDHRGFWLGLEWQGHGLMYEACIATSRFWFDVLGFPHMRVPKAAANLASRRISEREGMRLIRLEERDYVSGRLPTQIWEITAEEWRERHGEVVGEVAA
jgi:[ribosomal protein S5]-alanine N-acetyltransferase